MEQRYVIISSDTHAGGEVRGYKRYLDREWHDDFDAWVSALHNPFAEFRDPDYARLNWDSDFRLDRMDGQGVAGEVIFPNTLPPFFETMCHLSGVPPRHDVAYRHAVGVDRLMWGNDFPHPEGAAPYTLEALRATMWDVPEPECRAMLGGIAAGLYGFDVDALAPVAERVGPSVATVHTPLAEAPVSTAEAFA